MLIDAYDSDLMYVLWENVCSGSCMPSDPNLRAVRNNHSRKKRKQPYQRSNNARQDPTIQTLLTIVFSLSLSLSLSMSVSVSNHADGEQCWNLAAQHSSSWSTFLIANYPVSPRAPTSIRDILTVAKGPMLGSLCTVT